MKKRKLNYIFHNPNSPEATANTILKVMLDANTGKVEKALQAATDRISDKEERSVL